MMFSLIIKRYSKILNWKHDTYYASLMTKYVYFDDFMRFCNDNKENFSKRDIIASLTYVHHMKKVDLLSPSFNAYNDFIFSNINIFRSNISTLIHRYAILGHTKSLLFIYENVLKNNILNYDNKSISLIAWSYAKNNFYLSELFIEINKILRGCIKTMTLHELSLIAWAYSKINRLPPLEMICLKNRIYQLVNSLDEELDNSEKKFETKNNNIYDITMNIKEKANECDTKNILNELQNKENCTYNISEELNESKESNSQNHILENTDKNTNDNKIDIYGCRKNLTQDICMIMKSYAILNKSDSFFFLFLFNFIIKNIKNNKMTVTAQGIISIWVSLREYEIKNKKIIDCALELSRFLRLDHTVNSSMMHEIVTSIHKLKIKDRRILYHLFVHLKKKCINMHVQHLYDVIISLHDMKINDDDLWKQFGVAIQKKAIDLELTQIKKLQNIFITNGKKNDRILGVLDAFIQIKEDINSYGPI
ncbi:conserved Plasmodium protein, unknown function [Plasmodium berghei]|uniref:Uncharacterized protein n=2 Tax=Plasmodium berghei TaxID=5821 RepID=A0A509AIE6_PLABA|nr:conserved protein, unknown function [Plasmodium berghei ANKA]CXI43668.1 conserved Plasmodium protein, unknown function [Plasmodium berghei]SCM22366.1 conserved Plasmodium protein, unknown function [Plasmodium berghei]SCN25401.1 conserved Plasmodium protein, unknown function [Plasmodium berghei]SCO60381.1 conserved Plasmodium protein, unknown function [Plasmodium berghei]SCO62137.1 conserved Plasmodium protein, unknown function [Plasmodium berghei]|eukprot:XP_034421613.1 conserved protein, unknown function [Plasmodium berghei ANKA]